MVLTCSETLCEDDSFTFIEIAGFDNRYSTYASDSDRVRFDTYDPTGVYIIDRSAEASFDDLLTPTVASIDLDSL